MADISGYTAFVAGTEQDHSQEILAELMEAISRSFGGKLTVDQVEGDALCCTTDRTDVGVTDWLRETYRIFHRRLRDIRSATTCPCRACATVQDLGLKFVVHRGSFSRYEVAGRVQLHGNDVNLIHRLLKNTVPGREYLLATATALARRSRIPLHSRAESDDGLQSPRLHRADGDHDADRFSVRGNGVAHRPYRGGRAIDHTSRHRDLVERPWGQSTRPQLHGLADAP